MNINNGQEQNFSDCNKTFDENDLLRNLQAFIESEKDGYSRLDIPDTPTSLSDQQIIEANLRAGEIINSAKIAVINSYISHEGTRIENRKPILRIVAWLTLLQIVTFNALMGIIIFLSFKNTNIEIQLKLFDILKYYIGATVVELIGMLTFITTATFSSNHFKTMKLIFEENKKQ